MPRESKRGWDLRLRDMIGAAEKVIAYTQGYTAEGLRDNDLALYAVAYAMLIIGEAASSVSAAVRSQYPDLPWSEMIRMRNFVAHGYFKVDYRVIFSTATEDVPALLADLKTILTGLDVPATHDDGEA